MMMGGQSTDFGNPWWTKPFVGDAYTVVWEYVNYSGKRNQYVSTSHYRERPRIENSKWSGYSRVCYIIKWRWK